MQGLLNWNRDSLPKRDRVCRVLHIAAACSPFVVLDLDEGKLSTPSSFLRIDLPFTSYHGQRRSERSALPNSGTHR